MSKISISEDVIDSMPIGFGSEAAAVTPVDASHPLPVVQTGASTLPTGAATAANQATEITSLASIAASVAAATPAGANTIGGVIAKPATAGGLTGLRIVTGTTGVIKASAGQLYKFSAYNVNAAVRYVHLYDKATAPTLSTDTPVITIALLGAGIRDVDFTIIGAVFVNGIAWAYTTDDVAIPTTAGTSTELHATAIYN